MPTQAVEEKNCSLPLQLKQALNNKIPLPPRPEMKHVMFYVLSTARRLKSVSHLELSRVSIESLHTALRGRLWVG